MKNGTNAINKIQGSGDLNESSLLLFFYTRMEKGPTPGWRELPHPDGEPAYTRVEKRFW
ncbi:hypothetical protein [Bacteroides sp. 224]|uniref:hypothetical protein n=1 Tax=Bacteroides sp. 224 TaxID=2302936 RepID=UPI0013D0C4E6|nr:hypothetical protein [Bacteroides sp. 224]